MFCRYCGEEIKEGSKFCAKCGHTVEKKTVTEDKKWVKKIFVIIILFFTILVMIGGRLIGTEKSAKDKSKKDKIVVVEKKTCDAEGNTLEQTEYEYDINGKLEEKIYSNLTDGITKKYQYQYEYGEDERISKQIETNSVTGEAFNTEYEYNEAGEIKKEVVYNSEEKVTYWDEKNEKGNQIKFIYYDEDNGYHHKEYEYDEFENEIRYVSYNEDGSIQYESLKEYNNKNQKVSEHETIMGTDGGNYVYDYAYEYNDAGQLIKEIHYEEYGESNWIAYEYNENGDVIKVTSYCIEYISYDNGPYQKNNEFANWITLYEYDDRGRVITEINQDGEGNVKSRVETQYNNRGDILSEIRTGSDGEIEFENRYEYDEDGNKIKDYFYSKNIHEQTVMYDSEGNILEYKDYSYDDEENSSSEWWQAEYNKDNRRVKQILYNPDGSVKEYTEWKYAKINME